jgi:penicillin amidase
MVKGFISNTIQILFFGIFIGLYEKYIGYQKGEIYTSKIIKGASINRDENGFLNIEADNLNDAFFALGFAHAEERLWQMYVGYKLAAGETSEIFGKLGLDFDKFTRMLNLKNICKNTLKSFNDNEKKNLQAYTNGVNYYIQNIKVMPLEFLILGQQKFEWKNEYSCLSIKLVEYYLSSDFLTEIIRDYLVNKGLMSLELIEKIFPYSLDNLISRTTIIKDNERLDLRTKNKQENINNSSEKKLKNQPNNNNNLNSNNNNLNNNKNRLNLESTRQNLHAGSNNYVFSGKITEDGNPIIGNDPHLHNGIPGFWYFANIIIKEGNYHFVGVTHPGSSLFFMGQNGYVGWGITIGFADIADFIKLEKGKVNDNLIYKLDNNTIEHKLNKRIEKFYLSTNYNSNNYIEITYLDSEIGPVVNGYEDSLFVVSGFDKINGIFTESEKYYYILKSTFTNKYDNNFKAMMNFNFGKDIKSLMPLISDISICLNLVYADVKGNIGYHLTGKIPIRKNKKEGSYPKILEKEEDLITNYIPFDELPSLENPERGYIVTCNNLIISDNYKYILQGQFFGDHRYRSIENNILTHLKNGKKINTQFVIDKVINNVHDVVCEDLLKSIKELNTKEKYKSKFMEKFSEFNCQMERESKEALIYNAFITELVNSLPYISKEKINNIQDSLLLNDTKKIPLDTDERANYLYYFFQKFINDSNICQKEFNQSCSEFLDSIYNKAIKYLTNKLGRDREKYWKWKNLNYKIYEHVPFAQIPFFDLISSRRVKTNGNNFTPKVAGNHMSDRKYESILSSNLKFVSNIKNPKEFFISIDCGNSGKIFSEHYDDLCYSHEEGKLINYDYEKKRDYTLKFFNK